MSGVFSPTRAKIKERTLRTDKWWIEPLITFSVLISFIIYATFRAFENANYFAEPLISPFYSPCLSTACVKGASLLGTPIGTIAIFGMVISPALFILIFPLGFRMTCYYYRKAYYRSFWLSPPACAVAEPHKKYTGETRAPLIFQNAHRWFFYAGLVFNTLLTIDAVLAFKNADGQWGHMSVGSLVLLANATLFIKSTQAKLVRLSSSRMRTVGSSTPDLSLIPYLLSMQYLHLKMQMDSGAI